MTRVSIYSDGACKGNPGPGGWGVLLCYGEHEKEICGGERETTNNRMELTAAIEALKALKKRCDVMLYTDSQYVKNGIQKWVGKWKRNNWKTASGNPVKNQDLWESLDQEVLRHRVSWRWVKGHSGNPGNERADRLANQAIGGIHS